MAKFVALLRGINVGGKCMMRMADLRALCEDRGLLNVATYLQSGNVVFSAAKKTGSALEKLLAREIQARFDMDVAVIVRTAPEVAEVIKKNPFAREAKKDPTTVHVLLLANKPTAAQVRGFVAPESGNDAFRFVGREIYLHYPNGSARSKLNNALFERALAIRATARNLRTVESLSELAGNV